MTNDSNNFLRWLEEQSAVTDPPLGPFERDKPGPHSSVHHVFINGSPALALALIVM